jgi:hypothetical protein
MLYSLAIYQIISCSFSLIFFVFEVLNLRLRFFGLLSYLSSAILLGITGYVLYVNTEFISKRKLTRRFKLANQWFNISQVAHLSLLGVTLYCLVGPAITPALTYADRISWQVNLNFGFSFNLNYRPNDSDLFAGINLVPVLYLYLFRDAARKTEKSENFELDLFKTKTVLPPPPQQPE